MKKSLASKLTVLIAILALVLSLSTVAFAATTPTLNLSSKINSSNEVEVVISASALSDIGTLQATIEYDTSLVTYKGTTYLSGEQYATNTATDGKVIINDVWQASLALKADIVKVTFTINEGVDKTAAFSLTGVTATNSKDAPITFGSASVNSVTIAVKYSATTTTTTTTATTSSPNKGDTNDNNPKTTGRVIASVAGVLVAAAAGVTAVVVIKKKSPKED